MLHSLNSYQPRHNVVNRYPDTETNKPSSKRFKRASVIPTNYPVTPETTRISNKILSAANQAYQAQQKKHGDDYNPLIKGVKTDGSKWAERQKKKLIKLYEENPIFRRLIAYADQTSTDTKMEMASGYNISSNLSRDTREPFLQIQKSSHADYGDEHTGNWLTGTITKDAMDRDSRSQYLGVDEEMHRYTDKRELIHFFMGAALRTHDSDSNYHRVSQDPHKHPGVTTHLTNLILADKSSKKPAVFRKVFDDIGHSIHRSMKSIAVNDALASSLEDQVTYFKYGSTSKDNPNIKTLDFKDGSVTIKAHEPKISGDHIWQGYTASYVDSEGNNIGTKSFYFWDADTNRVRRAKSTESYGGLHASIVPNYADSTNLENVTLHKWKSGSAPVRGEALNIASATDGYSASWPTQASFFRRAEPNADNPNIRTLDFKDGSSVTLKAHEPRLSGNHIWQGYTASYVNAEGNSIGTKSFYFWDSDTDRVEKVKTEGVTSLQNYAESPGLKNVTLHTWKSSSAPLRDEALSIANAKSGYSASRETQAKFFKFGSPDSSNSNIRTFSFKDGGSVTIKAHEPGLSGDHIWQGYTASYIAANGKAIGTQSFYFWDSDAGRVERAKTDGVNTLPNYAEHSGLKGTSLHTWKSGSAPVRQARPYI